MCGASLEEERNTSRTITEQQREAFKEIRKEEKKKVLKGKGKGGALDEEVENEVTIGGDGRIKVVKRTQEELRQQKLATRQQADEADVELEEGDEDDDFFKRATKLAAAKKLKTG